SSIRCWPRCATTARGSRKPAPERVCSAALQVRRNPRAKCDKLRRTRQTGATSGIYLSPQAIKALRRLIMKKIMLSLAAAATALAVPVSASAADYNHHDRNGRYEQRYDHGQKHQSRYDNQRYRHFAKGQHFDSRYARNYRA